MTRIAMRMVPVHRHRGDPGNGSGDHGREMLVWVVSGIMPMRWEVMSVMQLITADIVAEMIPVIVAMAHPKERTDDHGRQDHQDRLHGMRCSDAALWRSRYHGDEVKALHGQGVKPTEIVKRLGINRASVYCVLD
jgi:hypothetical protein